MMMLLLYLGDLIILSIDPIVVCFFSRAPSFLGLITIDGLVTIDGLAVTIFVFFLVTIGFADSFRLLNYPKLAILILSLFIGVRPLAVFPLILRKSRNYVVLEEFAVGD